MEHTHTLLDLVKKTIEVCFEEHKNEPAEKSNIIDVLESMFVATLENKQEKNEYSTAEYEEALKVIREARKRITVLNITSINDYDFNDDDPVDLVMKCILVNAA